MNSVYIAMSIDGYIATKDNSVAWLDQFNTRIMLNPEGYFANRYAEFYETVDTVVQGRKTFDVVQSFGEPYPYGDKMNYILSRIPKETTDKNIVFLTIEEYEKLALQTKNWIVGGGEIIQQLLQKQRIDELIITIMPIFLGDGIPLFPAHEGMNEQNFDLVTCVEENGIVELTYRKKQE